MTVNRWIRHQYDYIREYGVWLFLQKGACNIYPVATHDNRLARWLLQRKHQAILKYLSKYNLDTDYINSDCTSSNNRYFNCIWTAWLHGEENAPEVIRMTIASMRRNAGNHRVIVLTEDNIADYVDVPEVIRDKHDRGIIGHAHYVDIVRMMILAKYGGLWLDSTMLLVKEVDEMAFVSDFYSAKRNQPNSINISKGRWIVGILGGKNGSQIINQIADMLTRYWINHNCIIDYFVFDYIIALLFQTNQSFNKYLCEIPSSNTGVYRLREIINEPYCDDIFQQMCTDTSIFSLPYRMVYNRVTHQGQETYYGNLLQKYLNSDEYAQ